jgi:hypothetical protein
MRNITPQTIFISHSSPEDNYFTAWLSSKLKLLGYEVWVEMDELKSGDAFWPKIENAIRNRSCKFISIVSQSYLQKITSPTSGVFKELSCADRITDINGFKTPIKIDQVSEDLFPVQLMGLHSINFFENWQQGLEELVESFEKEKISRNDRQYADPLNFWLDSLRLGSIVTNDQERIYTNWFSFKLPEKIYIHHPVVASKLDLADIPFSYLEYSDRHISFFPSTDYPAHIVCRSTYEFDIASVISEQVVLVDDFVAFSEPRKKVVQLINKIVEDYFLNIGMIKFEQSGGNVYYFSSNTENRKRISLKSIGKTNVAVTGKNQGRRWSFGISSYAILYPEPYLKINSHLRFKAEDGSVFGHEEHHTIRRKFAFDWYNKDWMDTLIGIMFKIAANDEKLIKIPIGTQQELIVNAIPLFLDSDFGYQEPANIEKDEK